MARPSWKPSESEEGLAVIRPLRSITTEQACVVEQAMNARPVPWRVERHDDYDGYLSLVISSEVTTAPTFAISGTVDQLELAELRNDLMRPHGCFSTVGQVVDLLVTLLSRSSEQHGGESRSKT